MIKAYESIQYPTDSLILLWSSISPYAYRSLLSEYHYGLIIPGTLEGTYLETAERDRKVVESDMFFAQANEEMKNSIIKANELLPKLKKLLKKEFE